MSNFLMLHLLSFLARSYLGGFGAWQWCAQSERVYLRRSEELHEVEFFMRALHCDTFDLCQELILSEACCCYVLEQESINVL